MWRGYGIAPQRGTLDHSAYVVLVDGAGRQRLGYPAHRLTPEDLAADLRRLGRLARQPHGQLALEATPPEVGDVDGAAALGTAQPAELEQEVGSIAIEPRVSSRPRIRWWRRHSSFKGGLDALPTQPQLDVRPSYEPAAATASCAASSRSAAAR